jgi:hypothetical protein
MADIEQEAREFFVQKINAAIDRLRNGPWPIELDEAESKVVLTMLIEGGMVNRDKVLDKLKTH